MRDRKNSKYKKYMKICNESGCISANYKNQNIEDGEIIIPYDNNESGEFKNFEYRNEE